MDKVKLPIRVRIQENSLLCSFERNEGTVHHKRVRAIPRPLAILGQPEHPNGLLDDTTLGADRCLGRRHTNSNVRQHSQQAGSGAHVQTFSCKGSGVGLGDLHF